MKSPKLGEIKVRLASIPNFAKDEYHPDQIKFYRKISELMHKALNLDPVCNFIKELVEFGNIRKDIELRIMRLPSWKSKIFGIDKKGRIIDQQLHGRAWKDKPLIDIYPDCHFPNKLSKPIWRVGIRGFILNSIIRGIIHEFLHKSGLKDEDEVIEQTKQHYRDFRRKYLKQFDEDVKPLLKEWKDFEKSIGLR